jgi:hypothetical protein
MIRAIARLLWELAQLEADPETHPVLRPLALHVIGLYGRPAHATTAEEWEEALLDAIAHRITEKWDRYGAPSAARTPEGKVGGQLRGPRRSPVGGGRDQEGGIPPGQARVDKAAPRTSYKR